MNAQDILQWVRDAGVSGLLLFALVGGFRKWWVFGWVHKEKCKECDEWKSLAMQSVALSERGTRLAREATSEALS